MNSVTKIETIDQNGNNLGEQTFTTLGDSEGIYCVDYKGDDYWYTGKSGTNIKTGKPAREFATGDDARLWMTDDETLVNLD